MKVVSLRNEPVPRIVSILKGLLEKAESGQMNAIYVAYREGTDMNVERDGFSDVEILWTLELSKARLLEGYV